MLGTLGMCLARARDNLVFFLIMQLLTSPANQSRLLDKAARVKSEDILDTIPYPVVNEACRGRDQPCQRAGAGLFSPFRGPFHLAWRPVDAGGKSRKLPNGVKRVEA